MSRELIQRIAKGEFDSELESLIRAAIARRKYLQELKGAENQATLAAGTKVRITPGIKPKYLVGLTGTVSSRPATRRGDLMFEFDPESYRYVSHRFRNLVGIPAGLLEPVAAEPRREA